MNVIQTWRPILCSSWLKFVREDKLNNPLKAELKLIKYDIVQYSKD